MSHDEAFDKWDSKHMERNGVAYKMTGAAKAWVFIFSQSSELKNHCLIKEFIEQMNLYEAEYNHIEAEMAALRVEMESAK